MSTGANAAKPPLTLADLTEEQAIQIAKLAYGDASFEFVKATTGNSMMATVQFIGKLTSEGRAEWMAGIYPDFSVWLRFKLGSWQEAHATNQRAIQKLFTEWGAESLLDREQMRREIMGQVTDFTSAIRHLYKALDASYAKDEEMAALRKDKEVLMQQYKNVLEAGNWKDLLIVKRGEQIQTLNELLSEQKKEINKLKGEAINQEAIINTLKYKIEQQAKEGSQPRTRTAADAQRGDRIWYIHGVTGQIEYDHIDAVGNGHITMIPNAVFIEDFGTKWGYAEEEAK